MLTEFRPLAPENLHLTLLFLGDQRPEKLDEIADIMLSICGQVRPFEISFTGWQLAGRGTRKRPLCLKVTAEPELLELQYKLNCEITRSGVHLTQRQFWPHLTLGRTPPLPQAEKLEQLWAEVPQKIVSDRVNLYQSRLLPQGAVHTLIQGARLSA